MQEEREIQSDTKLLENLFRQYQGKMYTIAFAILKNQHQAEDAVADAFEKLIPYLSKFQDRDEARIKVLLTRFVKNAAIDIYRKNKRERGNVSSKEQEWLADAYQPIEAYMKSLQHKELIQNIIDILPAHYWEVVRMRYLRGCRFGR